MHSPEAGEPRRHCAGGGSRLLNRACRLYRRLPPEFVLREDAVRVFCLLALRDAWASLPTIILRTCRCARGVHKHTAVSGRILDKSTPVRVPRLGIGALRVLACVPIVDRPSVLSTLGSASTLPRGQLGPEGPRTLSQHWDTRASARIRTTSRLPKRCRATQHTRAVTAVRHKHSPQRPHRVPHPPLDRWTR